MQIRSLLSPRLCLPGLWPAAPPAAPDALTTPTLPHSHTHARPAAPSAARDALTTLSLPESHTRARPAAPPAAGDALATHASRPEPHKHARPAATDPHTEVVTLTQSLVRVDSSPDNLVPGENQTVDIMVDYASHAGLDVDRSETVNGKPMLIVTLPGTDPSLAPVGFVHHSDVVGVEGTWTLGKPFSGDITHDEQGREVLVGRGSIDTKGPAAQVLVAMKQLKQSGQIPPRTFKLFVFPDEENGGREGAFWMSQNRPEKLRDVGYWLVESGGILGKETLDFHPKTDAPYLAVAQKYTIPLQVELKQPTDANTAVDKTLLALQRLDSWNGKIAWTNLGSKPESKEMYRRLGDYVGGLKGWAVRHFWSRHFMQERMGTSIAAANHTDFSKTDFYLSSNAAGSINNPNVKPSSATMILRLDLAGSDRDKALAIMAEAAGSTMRVDSQPGSNDIHLSLPQENYHGGNHGSIPDRDKDAIDVTNAALGRMRGALTDNGWDGKLTVVDYYTSKSQPPDKSQSPSESQSSSKSQPPGTSPLPTAKPTRDPAAGCPVTARATLDLRIAIDDDRAAILNQIQQTVGPDFKVTPLCGPEEFKAQVRRLSYKSTLFTTAEAAIKSTYGSDGPVLFGNTTASNDTRYLLTLNPKAEALAFTPVLYTEHGAHSPDECVTVDSLQRGVDWTINLMRSYGARGSLD